MTPERLAELRKLCESATPGPWYDLSERGEVFAIQSVGPLTPYPIIVQCAADYRLAIKKLDAEFIAASRTAIPELLDEVERLNAIIEVWKDYEKYVKDKLK